MNGYLNTKTTTLRSVMKPNFHLPNTRADSLIHFCALCGLGNGVLTNRLLCYITTEPQHRLINLHIHACTLRISFKTSLETIQCE